MFKLHTVQAQFGDCLILEFGTPGKPRFVLVDGGPPGTFEKSLDPSLSEIVGSRTLDLVVLSHIDNDHIVGLLDMFAAIESDLADGDPPRMKIGGLWHNSFQKSLDPTGEIAQRMQILMASAGASGAAMPFSAGAFFGVKEGNRLRILSKKLKIPVNVGFPDDLILADTAPPELKQGRLTFRVAGPGKKNLDALRDKWLKWLAKTERDLGDPKALANADRSVPNLSSLVLLASCDGKTILLTGDARSDHIMDGLDMCGLLTDGSLHVDVLKVPHHGSDRNAIASFFKKVTADRYVISADGTYGNPDHATLKWIVEAARSAPRRIEIIATNRTDSTDRIAVTHPPDEFGYKLSFKPEGKHSISIDLS